MPKTLVQVLEAIAEADGMVVLKGKKAFLLLPEEMEELAKEAREHGRTLAVLAQEAPGGRLTPRVLLALAQALLKEAGLEARRVPLSGSAPGYPGDLEVDLPGLGRVLVEVKARKWVALEAWLEGRGLLVLKPDRRPPLAVLPLEGLLQILHALSGGGSGPGTRPGTPPENPRQQRKVPVAAPGGRPSSGGAKRAAVYRLR